MKKKLNKPATQFPNIYRIIPESKLLKELLKPGPFLYFFSGFMLVVSLILIILISVLGIKFYENLNKLVQVTNQRQLIKEKINFWQSIVDRYEGYKDAHFQIAVLEYKLGDVKSAKEANTKTLLLDPNFDNAKKLEVLLNSGN